MRGVLFSLAFAALAGGGGAASADEPIGADAWRALTAGKTLYYYKDGELYGREYYPNDKGDVVFRFPNGFCSKGRWAFAEGKFCFAFEGELHCFEHVKRGDEIVVISDPEGDEQTVERIVDREPLSCDAALSS
ncbi:MAG: hypothetical protein ACK5MQ_04935 [Pikeienuella sp.]